MLSNYMLKPHSIKMGSKGKFLKTSSLKQLIAFSWSRKLSI